MLTVTEENAEPSLPAWAVVACDVWDMRVKGVGVCRPTAQDERQDDSGARGGDNANRHIGSFPRRWSHHDVEQILAPRDF